MPIILRLWQDATFLDNNINKFCFKTKTGNKKAQAWENIFPDLSFFAVVCFGICGAFGYRVNAAPTFAPAFVDHLLRLF